MLSKISIVALASPSSRREFLIFNDCDSSFSSVLSISQANIAPAQSSSLTHIHLGRIISIVSLTLSVRTPQCVSRDGIPSEQRNSDHLDAATVYTPEKGNKSTRHLWLSSLFPELIVTQSSFDEPVFIFRYRKREGSNEEPQYQKASDSGLSYPSLSPFDLGP